MDGYTVADFSEIDKVVKDILGTGDGFGSYVNSLINDGGKISFESIFRYFTNAISGEIHNLKALLVEMLLIIVLSAVFVNFSKTFKSRQVSETGFYIAYMLMFMLLAVSFGGLKGITVEVMNGLMTFMEALIPTFFMTVSYVSGSSIALVYYQSALVVVSMVDVVLVKIFLPLVNMYFVFSMINPLLEEDFFSKLTELIEKIIMWGIKSMFAIVSGVGLIQSLIIPAAGNIRKGLAGRTIGAIPGVGNTVGAAFESVYGAGILIKNAVGVTGLLIIVAICAVPLMRLCLYMAVYQSGAALAQPIDNDNRISGCISAAAKSVQLLFFVSGMSAVLFIIMVAIVTMATGIGA